MSANFEGKMPDESALCSDKSEHANAQQNIKTAQQVLSQKKRPQSKTHTAYWLDKVHKPMRSPHFNVQIAYRNERHRFPLETADKAVAAERARDRYLHLVAHGWGPTLERYKPKTVKRKHGATVGTLIQVSARLSSARKTSLEAYAQALRRIAAGTLGIDDKFKRNPAKNGPWRARVDSVPLEELTPVAVMAWKNTFLKASHSPRERNSAAVTFNALIRNSKALLPKKLRPFIEQELILPSPLWFEGVPREKEPSLRYHSKIDVGQILGAAAGELAQDQPEVYKALLLTLVCGLRRSEADALLWRQFNFAAGSLEIADTEHKALKSKDSAGVIGLDRELVTLLQGFRARATGEFVLEEPPRRGESPHSRYRCNLHFKALIGWLRGKGVPGIRPIHTLRKEIGSVIASREGIFAASRFLRHGTIAITAKIYADAKTPITAGVGSLLALGPTNVIKATFVESDPKAKRPTKRAKKRAADCGNFLARRCQSRAGKFGTGAKSTKHCVLTDG